MKSELILIFFLFISCSDTKVSKATIKVESIANSEEKEMYKINKIDSVNTYYLIYAKRKDTLYKIISKKESINNCKYLIVGGEYNFLLRSIWNQPIMIGNVNVSPSVTPEVTCLNFDDSTRICLEKDSIKDIHISTNIKGLCIMNKIQ